LHRSDRNESENPRWAMICCYNYKSNDPYKESHHPRYTKLEKVPDSTIMESAISTVIDNEAWMDPNHDNSAARLKK